MGSSKERFQPPSLHGKHVNFAELFLKLCDSFGLQRMLNARAPVRHSGPTPFGWNDRHWRDLIMDELRSQLFRKNPNQIGARNFDFSHPLAPRFRENSKGPAGATRNQ
jgi:hypothetical protein